MISLDDLVRVANAYLDTKKGVPCHALTRSDGLPSYRPAELQPAICAEAISNPKVGSVCREFYRSLPMAAGKTTCPYGITILYHRITVSGHPVCLYQQVRFSANPEAAINLPRTSKKAVKKALTNESGVFNETGAQDKFDGGKDVISTLLTGRVAESIRALSHHLLTPLQGALADADSVGGDAKDSDERIVRLKKNLEGVSAAAKQIQILLSDEAEFTPQKLRKVTVHSLVKEVMDGIKDEALGRFILINQGFNHHSLQVDAIPDQFFLVLSNILQNCVKYSFDGTTDHPRTVRVTYDSEQDRLVVRFQNVGCGIDEDEIREGKIFELGYRGRKSGDRGRSGTGSGLYIAGKITKDFETKPWSGSFKYLLLQEIWHFTLSYGGFCPVVLRRMGG